MQGSHVCACYTHLNGKNKLLCRNHNVVTHLTESQKNQLGLI